MRSPRPIAQTSLRIAPFGFGGGTLGDPTEITSDAQAQATLQAAYDGGVRHYDTAPWYGNTKSEHRVGAFLRNLPRDAFTISTKVGRIYSRPVDPATFHESPWMQRWRGGLPFDLRFDYTRDGILRSYEDSLQRLGLNTVDALAIHDLDLKHQRSEDGVATRLAELESGGYQALADLKSTGQIRAIGAGVNHVGMIPRFLERFPIDYFLVAMPYTLLDQPALDQELPLCAEHGVSVIIGAVFASGILATGASSEALYAYKPAEAAVHERVRAIESVCDRHGVPLAAAALQFPLGHPAVVSVIPGANSPEQVRSNLAHFRQPIPAAFWDELKAQNLLRADAPVPTEPNV